MLKFNEIVKFADKCIYNVEHKQTASIDSVRNYTTLAYLFSKAILRVGKDTGIKRIKENPKRVLQCVIFDNKTQKPYYLLQAIKANEEDGGSIPIIFDMENNKLITELTVTDILYHDCSDVW